MSGSTYVYRLILKAQEALDGLSSTQKAVEATTKKVGSLQEAFNKMGKCAFAMNNISDMFGKLGQTMSDMAEPGLRLNESMHALAAVSGVTGNSLKQIEGYARQAAKTFGGSAADSVGAYQLVLSQLGPHIAQVPEALAAMGDAIKTTSKLMGNDTVSAAEVLTTALNQYQVSLDDPIEASKEMARMMNVMAAAGRAGSAELPTIKEALRQCGMVAKTAGVSFEEANAAIQMLDKAGKKGSEGGVALRNVMATLTQGRFLPKDVQDELAAAGISVNHLADRSLTLVERLRALKPVMNDQALISKMFGRENSAAAIAILAAIDSIKKLTEQITGTISAYDQAGIIMESDIEKMSRFQAKIDNVKISLHGVYSKIYPVLSGVGSAIKQVANLAMIYNTMHTFSETTLGIAIRKRTAATWGTLRATYAAGGALGIFSVAALVAKVACHALAVGLRAVGKAIYSIPIIGRICLGIDLLIAGFKLLWDKCEGFRMVCYGIWEVVKNLFSGFVEKVKGAVERIKGFISGIKERIRNIRENFINIFSGLKERFGRFFDPVRRFFDKIKNLIRSCIDKLKEWLEPVIKPIRDIFEKVSGWFKTGAQKGKESFAKDHSKQEEATTNTDKTVAGIEGMPGASDISEKITSSEKIDLNNIKGSSDYGAIAAKLTPKTFAGMGGGKTVSSVPQLPSVATTAAPVSPLPSFLETPEDKNTSLLTKIAAHVEAIRNGIAVVVRGTAAAAKTLITPQAPPQLLPVTSNQGRSGTYVAKFCDTVSINVPSGTTADQANAIINELMRRINNAVE